MIAFFGHHKCGTGWIREMLVEIARFTGLKHAYVYNAQSVGGDLARFVRENAVDLLIYDNADPKQVERLSDFKGFHVIRDPRDLVVSAYFSHRYSHPLQPWLEEHRARLEGLEQRDGLLAEITYPGIRWVLGHIRNWDYRQPNVMEVRLEQLIRAPAEQFMAICKFVGLNLSERKLARIVRRHSFEVKSGGRFRGEEDIRSHYRKGIAGDWKNHFDEEHLACFKREFGDIVERLGYDAPGW